MPKKTVRTKLYSSKLERLLAGLNVSVWLVENSPRGLDLRETGKDYWATDGYVGDGRFSRWAIECVARNGRVVAAIAWNRKGPASVKTLGTYVHHKLQGKGIATALWDAMFLTTGAWNVYTEPVTHAGLTLVRSLEEKNPGVRFYYAKRPIKVMGLKDLRK